MSIFFAVFAWIFFLISACMDMRDFHVVIMNALAAIFMALVAIYIRMGER